ncbi:mycE, partial [Symbiodinium microadriaticum]
MRVQPHAALWGSALGTCGQKGAWDTALVLLKDLSQRTLQRDALCLASALGAAEVAGAWDHALELLLGVLPSDAGECWHEPTDLLCSTGLQACAQSSWHLAPELLRQASKAALQPSILSQNAVLSSLDSDSWPCALELFLGARSLSVTIRSSLIGSVATNLKPSSTAWELSA